MDIVITEYQKWKEQGESLRAKAKLAMETRFREILAEAVDIAMLYRQDFGAALKPPPSVTAFKFKAGAKAKGKTAVKAAKPGSAPAKAEKAAPKHEVKSEAKPPNPHLLAMRKKLEQITKKLEAARAAGQSTKNLEDKIYELEDTIRLAELP
jgi:hypothetical protein